MDAKRNAYARGKQPPKTAATMGGGMGSQGELPHTAPNEDAFDLDNNMSDANLNLAEFLSQKAKKPREMAFKRVVTSQGGATFDDIKQDLDEFHRRGRKSLEGQTVSRKKHQ